MKNYAIIVAGGSGKRMSGNMPKQYLNLAGKPILMHTIERFAFHPIKPEIILVLPTDSINFWKSLCEEYQFKVSHVIVEGGQERYFSVKNALKYIANCEEKLDCDNQSNNHLNLNGTKKNSLIAIHDAVRPLLSEKLIQSCFDEAEEKGSAIPYIKSSDSLRHLSPHISGIINREEIALVQTPQIFSREIIMKAYQLPYQNLFTDDASVVEAAGNAIHLVEGERQNIKITFPLDLKLAELILSE